MAKYDGYKLSEDHLLQVAGTCSTAAAKAPTLTGKLGLKLAVITGEDLMPAIEFMEGVARTAVFLAADALGYRKMLEQNPNAPVLLLGADMTKPIGWNCGGCGFTTCAEFSKYIRKNKDVLFGGPSCLWKMIDLGIAADYACAAAARQRVEARIQVSFGMMWRAIGSPGLEGSSMILSLPLGQVGSSIWFDRKYSEQILEPDRVASMMKLGSPSLWLGFSGTGQSLLKTKQRWWEDPDFLTTKKE